MKITQEDLPCRVLYKDRPGHVWGIGYDPKGTIYMTNTDDGERYIQARLEDLRKAPGMDEDTVLKTAGV